jgi:hypothetical protein
LEAKPTTIIRRIEPMNKTAVKYFYEAMVCLGFIENPDDPLVQEYLRDALEDEKQQIINSYEDWPVATRGCQNGLEYYEANYGGKDA